MPDPNIHEPSWDAELGDAPFRLRALRVGAHAGARELEPGAVVAFPRSAEGAHHVSNAAEAPARVLLISTMNFPEVAEHLDTGAVLAMTGAEAGHVFPAGSDRPVMEMLVAAMEAGAQVSP